MTVCMAIFSLMNGDNKIFKVTASNPIEAAKKAAIEHCPEKYRDKDFLDWISNAGESYPSVQATLANSDLILSDYIIIS